MNITDLKNPNYELPNDESDFNNVWVQDSGCDYIFHYRPFLDGELHHGRDGAYCSGNSVIQNNKYIVKGTPHNIFLVDAPFFLKKCNLNLWFDGNNTASIYAYRFRFGLFIKDGSNITRKYSIPTSTTIGGSLANTFQNHNNHIQIITDVEEDKLYININSNGYHEGTIGSLNRSQKYYFGFEIIDENTGAEDIEIVKAINYTTNLNTEITLTRKETENNRFNITDKITFTSTLVDEYGKPINETLRLFCNNTTYADFDTTIGNITKGTGDNSRYYLAPLSNGQTTFALKNKEGKPSQFDVQTNLKRNYLYNGVTSQPIRCYYWVTTSMDISDIVDSMFYTPDCELNLHAKVLDNHGEEIPAVDVTLGKIWVNGSHIQNWNNESENVINPVKPAESTNYRYDYTVKWRFSGTNLYQACEITKKIEVKKAKLSVELSDLGSHYYFPDNVTFNIDVTCDNPDIEVPYVKLSRGEHEITYLEGSVNDYVRDDGLTTYLLTFHGNDSIVPFSQTFGVNYHIRYTSMSLVETGGTVYTNTPNYISILLVDSYGEPLANKLLNTTLSVTDSNNEEYTRNQGVRTDENGIATIQYTYYTTDNHAEATGTIYVRYAGEGNYYQSTLNAVVYWEKRDDIIIIANVLKDNGKPPAYPNPVTVEGRLVISNNPSEEIPVPNATLKYYRNDTYLGTGVTDNDGKVTFTNRPPPNNPTDTNDVYVYRFVFDGDNDHLSCEGKTGKLRYLNSSILSVVQRQSPKKVFEQSVLKVKLQDNKGVLYGTHIRVEVSCIKTNKETYEMSENASHQRVTTDDDGIATLPFTTRVAGEYTFNFIFDGTNTVAGNTLQTTIRFDKLPTEWRIVESDNVGKDVLTEGGYKYRLVNKNTDEPLSNIGLQKSLSFKTLTNQNVSIEGIKQTYATTDENGEVEIKYTPTLLGDIVGTFKVVMVENDTYIASSKSNDTVTWNKIRPSFTTVSKTGVGMTGGVTEVTLKGSIKFKLTNSRTGAIIPNANVVANVRFNDLNGVSTSVEGASYGELQTGNDGCVTLNYTPMTLGNVIGTFAITKTEEDLYKQGTKTDTIQWNKIKTKVSADDVEIYNGRYTNLKKDTNVDWTKTSPGVDNSYTNFHTKLETLDTNTSYVTVPNGRVRYFNWAGTQRFETDPVNATGDVYTRWTMKFTVFGTYRYKVRFEGNNLFEASECEMNITILKRIVPELTYSIVPHEGQDNIRYNIPFKINVTLREGETYVAMVGQTLMVYFNGRSIAALLTDNTGKRSWTGRVNGANDVGTKGARIEFDSGDLIDKYEPLIETFNITVDKDEPYLQFSNLPKTLTDSCANEEYTAKVELFNSIGEKISTAEKVWWYENIGDSYDGNCFEVSEVGSEFTLITQTAPTTWVASNVFSCRSGVKLIRAVTEETWRYFVAEVTSWLKYDIDVTYGTVKKIEIDNGIGEFSVTCELPLGLYDVKIDYVGIIDEESKCQKYSNANTYYGVHRKKGTLFKLDKPSSNYDEEDDVIKQEVTKQFSGNTTLVCVEDDDAPLRNKVITTNVDNINKLVQKTDDDGNATRHHMDTEVNHESQINFRYEQTRNTAGVTNTFNARTIPLKPIIAYVKNNFEYYLINDDKGKPTYYRRTIYANGTVGENTIEASTYDTNTTIDNYMENNFPMKVRAFYYRKHYDKYGEEIKYITVNETDIDIYHSYDDNGDDIYYSLQGKTKTAVAKPVYDNASSYNDFIPIVGADMVWRNSKILIYPSTKENVIVKTDENGYAEATEYHRHTLGLADITVHVENDPYYDENSHLTLHLNTLPRVETVLTNQVIENATYNEPCDLNCIVKDINGNTVKDVSVRFKKSGTALGTGVTGTNGKAILKGYVPTNASNFKYQCILDPSGIYAGSQAIFEVVNHKQTPLIKVTATMDDYNDIEYNEDVTVTATLTESENSVNNGKGISNVPIQFFIVDMSTIGNAPDPTYSGVVKKGLGTARTDKNGVATLTAPVRLVGGNCKIWAIFEGDKRVNDTTVTSEHGLFHWAFGYAKKTNGNELSLNIKQTTVLFTNLGDNSGKACTYGQNEVRLTDRKNRPLANKTVALYAYRGTADDPEALVRQKYPTNDDGIVGVKFTEDTGGVTDNIRNYKIDTNNMGETYYLKYFYNIGSIVEQYGFDSYDVDLNYKTATYNGTFTYEKAKTYLTHRVEDNDGNTNLIVTLICDENEKPIGDASIKFYDGNTLKSTKTTTNTNNSVGEATFLGSEAGDGQITVTAKFEGTWQYYSCQKTVKYENNIVDDCTDLATFTTLTEYWYASYENRSRYLRNMLRNYCNERKYEGSIDSEDGVHAPTGVIMRCNSIATTDNCDVYFKLKFKSTRSDGGFGGHFGLMQPTYKTAETSPARFEFFKQGSNPPNQYFITMNDRNSVRHFNMTIKYNVFYNMVFEVRGTTVTCKNLDTGESYTTTKKIPNGLNPYIMTFLNGCEMIIRELKMVINK